MLLKILYIVYVEHVKSLTFKNRLKEEVTE